MVALLDCFASIKRGYLMVVFAHRAEEVHVPVCCLCVSGGASMLSLVPFLFDLCIKSYMW